jgi:hypothetical protein
VSAFTTVRLADAYGRAFPFVIVAGCSRCTPRARATPRSGPGPRLYPRPDLGHRQAAAVGQLAVLYAVSFGGFVAFSVYLPAYLRNAYELAAGDAHCWVRGARGDHAEILSASWASLSIHSCASQIVSGSSKAVLML